jgi:hypothetical protein
VNAYIAVAVPSLAAHQSEREESPIACQRRSGVTSVTRLGNKTTGRGRSVYSELLPYDCLSLESSIRVKVQKFLEFLLVAVQIHARLLRELTKPRSVPSSRNYGVTEVAERDYVFGSVGATLRARGNMVGVKHAVGITPLVATDLTLFTVPALHEVRKPPPMGGRIVRSTLRHGEAILHAKDGAITRI